MMEFVKKKWAYNQIWIGVFIYLFIYLFLNIFIEV